MAFGAFILGPGALVMGTATIVSISTGKDCCCFVGIALLSGLTALLLPRYEQDGRLPDPV